MCFIPDPLAFVLSKVTGWDGEQGGGPGRDPGRDPGKNPGWEVILGVSVIARGGRATLDSGLGNPRVGDFHLFAHFFCFGILNSNSGYLRWDPGIVPRLSSSS